MNINFHFAVRITLKNQQKKIIVISVYTFENRINQHNRGMKFLSYYLFVMHSIHYIMQRVCKNTTLQIVTYVVNSTSIHCKSMLCI